MLPEHLQDDVVEIVKAALGQGAEIESTDVARIRVLITGIDLRLRRSHGRSTFARGTVSLRQNTRRITCCSALSKGHFSPSLAASIGGTYAGWPGDSWRTAEK